MKKSLKLFLSLMAISYSIIFALQVLAAQDRAARQICMMGGKCPEGMIVTVQPLLTNNNN
tara:strand:+ start:664 stop:843 length:180 start_codon:yes stop_codon:yes gene_type:complete